MRENSRVIAPQAKSAVPGSARENDREDQDAEAQEDPASDCVALAHPIRRHREVAPSPAQLLIQGAPELREVLVELLLEGRDRHPAPRREQVGEQQLLVGPEARVGLPLLDEGEIAIGEEQELGGLELFDLEKSPHREVEDRRGDVLDVDLLVHDRTQLGGSHAFRRLVGDRDGVSSAGIPTAAAPQVEQGQRGCRGAGASRGSGSHRAGRGASRARSARRGRPWEARPRW